MTARKHWKQCQLAAALAVVPMTIRRWCVEETTPGDFPLRQLLKVRAGRIALLAREFESLRAWVHEHGHEHGRGIPKGAGTRRKRRGRSRSGTSVTHKRVRDPLLFQRHLARLMGNAVRLSDVPDIAARLNAFGSWRTWERLVRVCEAQGFDKAVDTLDCQVCRAWRDLSAAPEEAARIDAVLPGDERQAEAMKKALKGQKVPEGVAAETWSRAAPAWWKLVAVIRRALSVPVNVIEEMRTLAARAAKKQVKPCSGNTACPSQS